MSPMVRRPPGMELALLGFLSQGPAHGYQIHQLVSDPDGLGLIWRLKQSQLYALLLKLEQHGYIQAEIEVQEPAHPPRKVYHLTTTGQGVYQNWLQTPVTANRLIRQELMAKLYFARREGSRQAQILLDAQRAACQKWLEALNAEPVEPTSFNWLLHKYRIGQIKATLDWLDSELQEVG